MSLKTIATQNGTFTSGENNLTVDVTGANNQLTLSGDHVTLSAGAFLNQATLSGRDVTVNFTGSRDSAKVSGGGFINATVMGTRNELDLTGSNQTFFAKVGGVANVVNLGTARGYLQASGHSQSVTAAGAAVIDASGEDDGGIYTLTGKDAFVFGGKGDDLISFVGSDFVWGGKGADTFKPSFAVSPLGNGGPQNAMAYAFGFSESEDDKLNLSAFSIGKNNPFMAQRLELVNNDLVIHPNAGPRGPGDSTFHMVGVGYEIAAHGGVAAAIADGHIII